MSNGIFIIGTDTDVGKTVISASLGWKLSKGIRKVCIMKPFATGPEIYSKNYKSEDVSKLVNSINLLENEENINPFFYPLPCSPFMASKILNQEPPDLAFALSKFRLLSKKYDYIIIEGIGGVLVPITRKKTLIDFIKLVGLDVIIVSLPKVGTINHTLLTINECVRKKIQIRGIIINKMPLKPNIIEAQTPYYLQKLTSVPILGIIPELGDLHYNDETFDLISGKIDFD